MSDTTRLERRVSERVGLEREIDRRREALCLPAFKLDGMTNMGLFAALQALDKIVHTMGVELKKDKRYSDAERQAMFDESNPNCTVIKVVNDGQYGDLSLECLYQLLKWRGERD